MERGKRQNIFFIVMISIALIGIFSFGVNNKNITGNVVSEDWCQGTDFNQDGKVDYLDNSIWGENINRTDCSESNNWCNNVDINQDGKTGDIVDLSRWGTNYGRTDCSGPSESEKTASPNACEVAGFVCGEEHGAGIVSSCSALGEYEPITSSDTGISSSVLHASCGNEYTTGCCKLKENKTIAKPTTNNDWCQGADFNRDGKVDYLDNSIWGENINRTDCSESNNWCNNVDINQDGKTGDIVDLSRWGTNYGRTDCSGPTQTPSPEPTPNPSQTPPTNSGGSSGGGGSSSKGIRYDVSESKLNSGYSKKLKEEDYLRFRFNEDYHYITIEDIKNNVAKIEVKSTPQTTYLREGESEKFELNGDNYLDLEISVESISSTYIDLTAKAIKEELYQEEVKEYYEEQADYSEEAYNNSTEEKETSIWVNMLIGFAISFILFIILGFLAYKRKSKEIPTTTLE